jgi:hypothetical protein
MLDVRYDELTCEWLRDKPVNSPLIPQGRNHQFFHSFKQWNHRRLKQTNQTHKPIEVTLVDPKGVIHLSPGGLHVGTHSKTTDIKRSKGSRSFRSTASRK